MEERVIFEVQGEKRHKRSLNARLTISVLMLTKNINLRLRSVFHNSCVSCFVINALHRNCILQILNINFFFPFALL